MPVELRDWQLVNGRPRSEADADKAVALPGAFTRELVHDRAADRGGLVDHHVRCLPG